MILFGQTDENNRINKFGSKGPAKSLSIAGFWSATFGEQVSGVEKARYGPIRIPPLGSATIDDLL